MGDMDTRARCEGITLEDTRCSRREVSPGARFCRSHKDQIHRLSEEEVLDEIELEFVNKYIQCKYNASEAGRQMYMGGGRDHGREYAERRGRQLANRPHVQDVVRQRIRDEGMNADETLARLSDMGRASVAIFLDEDGRLDLTTNRARQHMHLIKSIKHDSIGQPVIELHDSKDALKTIAKINGMIHDRVEHSGEIAHTVRPQYDYSVLDDEELDTLEGLIRKLESTIDAD